MADRDPTNQKPQHNHPHGMEPYDLGGENNLGGLSKQQQDKLNKFKVPILLKKLLNIEL